MKISLITCLLFSLYCSSQNLNGDLNSGGVSTSNLFFTVGEIYVIEKTITKEVPEFLEASIIPNPVDNLGILKIDGNLNNKNLDIYTISGILINVLALDDNFQIYFNTLPSGIYIIKSQSNEFSPIKVIKN